MAKEKKSNKTEVVLNNPDIMHPDNSPEFSNLLQYSSLVRMLYQMTCKGQIKRVERSKPFQAVKSKKAPILNDQVYEWVMYYFGKYNAPKWFKALVKSFPIRELSNKGGDGSVHHSMADREAHRRSSDQDLGAVVLNLMENDVFQGLPVPEIQIPERSYSKHVLGLTPTVQKNYLAVSHIILGVLHMNGQSPFKDGIKVMIENAILTTIAKVQQLANPSPLNFDELAVRKQATSAFYTKKELHALLNCPHSFDSDAISLHMWALGEHVATKSYLKRMCEYGSRLHLHFFNTVELRKLIYYFSEVSQDIELKEQEQKQLEVLKQEWEASYQEEGLDFEHFTHKWKKKKDKYVKYRQDLSFDVIQDLMDYLNTTAGRPDGFKNAMHQSLATLQDESERWHRAVARTKTMSQPGNTWTPRFPQAITYVKQQTSDPTKGMATQFEELCTGAALAEEGQRQRHCVGSYVSRCKAGAIRIVSMRTFDVVFTTPGDLESYHMSGRLKHVLTIELNGSDSRGWKAVQVRGYANRVATPQENNLVERWLRSFNSDFTDFLKAA